MRYLVTITTNRQTWDASWVVQLTQFCAAHDRFQAEVMRFARMEM